MQYFVGMLIVCLDEAEEKKGDLLLIVVGQRPCVVG